MTQAQLEKTVKELNVRVVDLETRGYANSPRAHPSRRQDRQVEELTAKLTQESREKQDNILAAKNADKTARDVQFELQKSERMRARYETDLQKADDRVETMKTSLEELVSVTFNVNISNDTDAQTAARLGAPAVPCEAPRRTRSSGLQATSPEVRLSSFIIRYDI